MEFRSRTKTPFRETRQVAGFFMCCCADRAFECQENVLRAGIKKGAYAPSSIDAKSGSK